MNIKANPEVTYTLEGFFKGRDVWLTIHSGLKEIIEIPELLDQLKIDAKCPRNPCSAFRLVKITREVVHFVEVE